MKFSYHYTVTPTNFVTLTEAKQRKKIGGFFDMLRVIQKPIRIRLARKILSVPIDGQVSGMPILQLYVSSNEPLNQIFEMLRYEYAVDLGGGHKGMKIIQESWRDLTVDPGDGSKSVAKCFTLHSLPYELPWAWIATGIFPACYEIVIYITPVSHKDSLNYIRKRKEMLYESAGRSRSSAAEYEKLERAEESMRQTHSGLYRCKIICVILGHDKKSLKSAVREFRNVSSISGGVFCTQTGKQGAMLSEGWGKTLTFDLGSTSCLYSMVSGDMLEVPNGLVLGINTDSGAPVIFDFQKRTNYNVAIIGTSGSGKSFTAKMILRRLLEKYPDSLCFVIDPMGEYYDIASSLSLDRIQITGDDELGFDPFKLLEPADAADILGNVTRAPEDVVKQFRKFSDKVDSIDKLYDMLKDNPESQKWLDDLVDGPLAKMMRGTPKISDRLVISMRKADGKPHEIMLLILALNKVWKRIEEMPQDAQKIVLLDEAWMLFKMEGAAKYIEQIVRMGRKRNVKFLFVSQNVDDIAKDRGGANKIVDNMETKILLNMEEEATDGAAKILGLSPQETARIKSFESGHAIMMTKKYRLDVKFEPSEYERKTFDTSPQDEP